jgi:hypothetical protein
VCCRTDAHLITEKKINLPLREQEFTSLRRRGSGAAWLRVSSPARMSTRTRVPPSCAASYDSLLTLARVNHHTHMPLPGARWHPEAAAGGARGEPGRQAGQGWCVCPPSPPDRALSARTQAFHSPPRSLPSLAQTSSLASPPPPADALSRTHSLRRAVSWRSQRRWRG